MKKGWKIALSVVVALVAIVALTIGGFNWYINASKPKIEGELQVDVLEQEVSVVRDEAGVPHITAQTEADLYRAQGYIQAQDRLFQMDLSRRQASGRLAEVVGEAAVDTDKFFRTFSLRHAAEASYDGYDDESKQVLQWFAEGVNAFIAEGKLSYEFSVLGYEPEEWTPIDSLTIGKYMAYDLGGHWNLLAFRHWAVNNLSEELYSELDITYPEDAKTVIAGENAPKVASWFDAAVLPNEFNGSNNWVVSGDKTASGKPLLADDPHLGLGTPSIWYQMHLQSPEQNVSGVIFAGIPGIILGHNDNIAWGVTNVGPSVQDLYIERTNPENIHEFLYDGEYYKADVREENINVKGGDVEEFEVVTTKHGPIISDLIFEERPASEVYSMQWTALEATKELQAILAFNKAKSWDEFETALEDFNAPAQNFVFASTDGTIAYKANGNIPVRLKGDGTLPVPGDSSEYGWSGYIPYDELPTVVNPEEGFIATANNKIVSDDYPYHITDMWAQPYRYERIVELLEGRDDLTVEDMQAMQMDTVNLYAKEFLPKFITSIEKLDEEKQYSDIVAALKEWDYNETIDAPEPLVFNLMIEHLKDNLFRKSIPDDVYKMMQGKYQAMDNIIREGYEGKEGAWLTSVGGVDVVVYNSFIDALNRLQTMYPETEFEDWKWGDYHQLTFDHPLASNELLARFLNPASVPVGGSRTTVMAAGNPANGLVDHGAAWRFVADLNDLSSAYHINGPGQSGHFKSQWYADQVSAWADGDYTETRIDGTYEQSHELILKP
ncbi:penicillin acylase family protein [Caryophanon latum]|uniref:Beta-lactam antibiotic acylase n=1 Tax=Caryophanon latum TaxID=33977 RepID=A0A1C0YTG4_9BACL|nr:penicillin acylase family protein [Caryophanon latum]OCS90434.1 beta-lactam antibiotic acylase [Caryophanon latum]